MDIKKLKGIINLPLPEDKIEEYIISFIAEDKEVIPNILRILGSERAEKNNLISDMNTELSRALVLLQDKNIKYGKKVIVNPNWVIEQIINHYKKWKDYIKCNFKVEGLD